MLSFSSRGGAPAFGRMFLSLPALAVGSFALFACAVFVSRILEDKRHEQFKRAVASVKVVAPEGIPAANQESIEIAMQMYGINKPEHVVGPVFDANLADRGLTTGGTLDSTRTVTIGPAAFTSWGVLGSTLAHEIEVHANQSFLGIVIVDKLDSVQLSARKAIGAFIPAVKPTVKELFEGQGTWKAERDAYQYELAQAERFGLSDEEKKAIFGVMSYYYPENRGAAGVNR